MRSPRTAEPTPSVRSSSVCVCVGGPSLVVGGQDAELVLAGRCCAKGLTATRDFQDAFSRSEEQKVGGGAG